MTSFPVSDDNAIAAHSNQQRQRHSDDDDDDDDDDDEILFLVGQSVFVDEARRPNLKLNAPNKTITRHNKTAHRRCLILRNCF